MTRVNSENRARVRIPMPYLEHQSYSKEGLKETLNRICYHLLPTPNNINEIKGFIEILSNYFEYSSIILGPIYLKKIVS
jgi:hypothetical protein